MLAATEAVPEEIEVSCVIPGRASVLSPPASAHARFQTSIAAAATTQIAHDALARPPRPERRNAAPRCPEHREGGVVG